MNKFIFKMFTCCIKSYCNCYCKSYCKSY